MTANEKLKKDKNKGLRELAYAFLRWEKSRSERPLTGLCAACAKPVQCHKLIGGRLQFQEDDSGDLVPHICPPKVRPRIVPEHTPGWEGARCPLAQPLKP